MFLPMDTHSDGQQNRQSVRKAAKMALLLAFAGTADAFQPMGLKPFLGSKASIARISQQVPSISLRQGNEKPAFFQALKLSAVDPACREKMYEIAQASFILGPYLCAPSLCQYLLCCVSVSWFSMASILALW
jgi:hypothetical protein